MTTKFRTLVERLKRLRFVRVDAPTFIGSMVRRPDNMLCEICEERPATHAVPRGPRNEGHLWVCDGCNPYCGRSHEG